MICQYCGQQAELVGGLEIYPRRYDLAKKQFYLCRKCNAYVGCHRTTTKPLGTLANRELRKWRKHAHNTFDPLWKNTKMSRKTAYSKLAKAMGIKKADCHIGQFTIELCKEAIDVCLNKKLNLI